jgi:hypothetical protein
MVYYDLYLCILKATIMDKKTTLLVGSPNHTQRAEYIIKAKLQFPTSLIYNIFEFEYIVFGLLLTIYQM